MIIIAGCDTLRAVDCRPRAFLRCAIRFRPNLIFPPCRPSKVDLANMQKKKDEEKALRELKAKAQQKGAFGGAGLKKSGKK
ncbi:uncharacterized protein LOC111448285 isoform X1 [Cucurbita moschata]|uniref:Uncharacterized protein LOC111448285 isoform X1 n=1 Tax=Cucurbita moschata TaxID=3662 RepID=A0A6J1FS07_CUCMO|nr:uncharacterized protein LOC111448285 isoform X1 [Cucurbita moschata]